MLTFVTNEEINKCNHQLGDRNLPPENLAYLFLRREDLRLGLRAINEGFRILSIVRNLGLPEDTTLTFIRNYSENTKNLINQQLVVLMGNDQNIINHLLTHNREIFYPEIF